MADFKKPVVVVSKCLGFAHCRYNGLTISSDVVDKLKEHVDFRTVCPEVEIGLGVPRDPIRIVAVSEADLRLKQPATERDVSDDMNRFADSFLNSVPEADGFILKNRSPSCGIGDVKVYPGTGKVTPQSRTKGFFGAKVWEKFPMLPIEDEGRLMNFKIRENFFTKLFTLSKFKDVSASGKMKNLVQFHSSNKLLLMANNQKELRILGRIVANPEKKKFDDVIRNYHEHLFQAFLRPARYPSNINVLMHAMGYFSKQLNSEEKAYFLDILEQYRIGKIPLSVPVSLIRSWIIRFKNDYLKQQTFFEPYPVALMEITDSGKGRNF
ncbi:DUF1722 domain-containing protein [candidate division KSB1 bacterium]|nr:DUF1722 domain-containing protein [candidate division KSB1 bacterium]